jgi:hypothetical protein
MTDALARQLYQELNFLDVLLGDRASWKVLGEASPHPKLSAFCAYLEYGTKKLGRV